MFATTPEEYGLDLLVFAVNSRMYALPATSVQEIVRAVWITAVPGAARVIEGVINYRGTLVPVLDVRARFGQPVKRLEPADLLIIAKAGARIVALRGDGVASVQRVRHSEIDRDGDTLATSPFVAGIARSTDGTIVIHDLAAFLTEAESATLDRALQNEQAAMAIR